MENKQTLKTKINFRTSMRKIRTFSRVNKQIIEMHGSSLCYLGGSIVLKQSVVG